MPVLSVLIMQCGCFSIKDSVPAVHFQFVTLFPREEHLYLSVLLMCQLQSWPSPVCRVDKLEQYFIVVVYNMYVFVFVLLVCCRGEKSQILQWH